MPCPDVTEGHVIAMANHKAVIVDLLRRNDDSYTTNAYHVSD